VIRFNVAAEKAKIEIEELEKQELKKLKVCFSIQFHLIYHFSLYSSDFRFSCKVEYFIFYLFLYRIIYMPLLTKIIILIIIPDLIIIILTKIVVLILVTSKPHGSIFFCLLLRLEKIKVVFF